MANLFFIHTPLQLMIAQMIIRQERLKDNVMLYGYVEKNFHFVDIYDLTIVDYLWNARVFMPQVANWGILSRKHLFRGGASTYRNYKFISQVICDYHIDTLFLGDMWNLYCQFTAMIFHRKGFRICFFEEGNGHYILPNNYNVTGNLTNKAYALILDALYYLPLYGVRMGYRSYWKGLSLAEIPMDVRYSVVPFYHEDFDILLTVPPVISDKLANYIANENKRFCHNANVLLMTSPIYEWMGESYEKDEEIYVKTIINSMKALGKGVCVHIKFHPREREYVCKKVLTELEKLHINYIQLGSEMNIPVEYYLQYIHYEKIVMFLSSTSFYNGYLFPKVKFVSILEDYYNNCKAAGSQSIHMIEPLLNKIPKE